MARNSLILSSWMLAAAQVSGACGGSSGPPRPTPDGDDPVPVSLHLIDNSLDGDETIVSFGAPYPRGLLTDLGELVLVDRDGHEVPSHVEETVPWRVLGSDDAGDGSIRAVRIYAQVELSSDDPTDLSLMLKSERTLELGPQDEPIAHWSGVERDDFPGSFPEPAVYASFDPEWLGLCGLRSYSTAIGSDAGWAWFDEFTVGAAETAVNELPDDVSEHIDLTEAEPWLFDRSMTLFMVYARTGDVRWLRHAHRAARYYAEQLEDGFFTPASGHPDLKYSYGQSLLIDLMLTGDTRVQSFIEDVAGAGETWDETYTPDRSFWTERHQTYALLAALSAWEMTGDAGHRDRVEQIAQASFSLAKNPAGEGWPGDGCMLHTLRAHEGDDSDDPVCSPWMSALFADAVWRYYLHSENDEALEFLAGLAQFVADHGIYDGSTMDDLDQMVPWYLASSTFQRTDSGPWADLEHGCDVAGLLTRGAWSRRQLGGDAAAIETARDQLISTCEYSLDFWHRPNSAGLPEWRLQPPRKFNWWFGTTTDMPWLVANPP